MRLAGGIHGDGEVVQVDVEALLVSGMNFF